jgi:hypothetical protein
MSHNGTLLTHLLKITHIINTKMNDIPLIPKTITTSTEVRYLNIEVCNLVLNEYALFKVLVSSIPKTQFPIVEDSKYVYVKLEGEEYSQWGFDDYYIIQKISEKLGVTVIT